MKIGEIAKAAGDHIAHPVLRAQGHHSGGDRGANGYRDYPETLITLLRFIEQAQGLGFTLREISDVEIGQGEHLVSCTDLLALLAQKRDSVIALIAEAQDRKRRIEALIADLEASRAESAA